jgi:hypothetical protein
MVAGMEERRQKKSMSDQMRKAMDELGAEPLEGQWV